MRATQVANVAPKQKELCPLTDRLPRPDKVDLVAALCAKQGNEISGAQMAALKNGTVKIDARMDLHGMTQHLAHGELNHFMKKQILRRSRLLLIISGKGKNLEGVLRAALPGWLMAGEFKTHILTIHPAHIRHGGDGATYVLLRKQK